MNMHETINRYKKEYVYEQYTRIVDKFKDYEKISKTKMLDAIYKVYDDPQNIINICTTKELKYLQMIIDKENNSKKNIDLNNPKYNWEKHTLRNKFLIDYYLYTDNLSIPEEIKTNVMKALKNVNWKAQKNLDNLNEILVGYFKIQGSALLQPTAAIISSITGIATDQIVSHMLYNKVFNYYVFLINKTYESLGKVAMGICHKYYELLDELDNQRKIHGLAGEITVDIDEYRTLFYNDFNTKKPIIKKFITEFEKLPIFHHNALLLIREYSLLNDERDSLKETIASIPALKNYDLTEIFKLMDKAMDEMPSGALNGFTPNEAKKIKHEEALITKKKKEKYIRQEDAHLSTTDAKLFYKIYFALLDFTNKKYKMNPKLKIDPIKGVNPYEISTIIEKFWANKDAIVLEFCLANPKKFNKEELKLTEKFKEGIRDIFVIIKYEKEYTALMDGEKIYMIKGLNDNIDNIIPNAKIPYMIKTTIIPFKNVLTYDGLFSSAEIKFGNNFFNGLEEEYSKSIKYYHL